MKILALNGSLRKNGNTEILLKQALMGCEAEGAEVEILKLTDFEIKPCKGCGLCLFKKDYCVNQGDGVDQIFDKVDRADGLLLGTPCYFLEATAVIKQLIDRCWVRGHQIDKKIKPASVIIPYATYGWISVVMLQPNLLLSLLGMKKVNQLIVNTQGITEVVLEQDPMDQAYSIGKELAGAVKSGDYNYRGKPGVCPLCHDSLLRIFNQNRSVECPLCGIRGELKIIDGRIDVTFDEKEFYRARLTFEDSYNHFTYHIKPSKEFFIMTKDERKQKGSKFKEYLKS
jgi:Multimeric flavodoxin WrbA